MGLAKLVPKAPKYKRRELVMSIMESASTLRIAQSEQRLRVVREIETELKNLPLKDLISLWTNALDKSLEYGRSEILIDICAFAPIFISRFGSEMALILDDAINIGGRNTWP